EDLSEPVASAGNEIVEEITDLALRYRLMSAYTSFVAVDESEAGGLLHAPRPPRRVALPLPLPQGVRYQGGFGTARAVEQALFIPDTRLSRARVMSGAASASAEYRAVLAEPPSVLATAGEADSFEDLGVEGGLPGGVMGGVPGGVVGGVAAGVA